MSPSTLKTSLAGQMAGVGGGGGFECWGGRRSCRFVGGGKALALEFPFVLLVFHVVVSSVCSMMNPIVSPAIHKNHNTNLSY